MTPSTLTLRKRLSATGSAGFTIIELLVTAVLIAVIFAAGAFMMVSHIKQSAIQESVRRLQDEWGRINYLMASEINEATAVSAVANTSLTLTLPGGQTITYSFDAATNTITRTGPTIKSTGQLDLANPSTTVDLINNVTTFTPTLINSREPSYAITLTDGRGNVFTGLSSAERTRTSSYP
jgi:prepilin-type N-terminal cleavage/methylation domain-containing protein